MPRQVDDPIKPLTDQVETAIAYLKSGTGEKEALAIIEKNVFPKVKKLESEASHYATYFLWASVIAAIFIAVTGILITYIAIHLRKIKWVSDEKADSAVLVEPELPKDDMKGYKGPKYV